MPSSNTVFEREQKKELDNIYFQQDGSCIIHVIDLKALLNKFFELGMKVESGKPVQQPVLFKGK